MKIRFMSMLLVLCMVFTLFPSAAFAEEAGGVTIGNTTLGTSSVTDSGAPTVCENHKTHTEDCGYIEAVEGINCSHQNEDGTYSCAPVKDSGDVSGNTASPGDAEEAYVCDHSDDCGYAEAVKGNPCTHECGLCKPAAKCDCIEECIAADDECGIEGHINPDCPFCAAEGADLAECKGEAPALLATPRAAITGDKGIFAGRYSHRQVFDCSRSPAYPVQGDVFTVSNFKAPMGSNFVPLPNIEGKIFHFKPSNVADAPFAFYMMDADGGNDTEIFASGYIDGLGAKGFLYTSDSVPFGTFISNEQVFNYGESLTYTPDIAMSISLAEGEKYAANDQPLGVEVTNTDTSIIYPTLQDAIDAVAEGDTLQLGKSLTEKVTIPSVNGNSFTIDLNGQTLDGESGTAIKHEGTGTLTITDNSAGKAGTVSSTGILSAISNNGAGTVAVSGGKVSSTSTNSPTIFNNSTGTVAVSGSATVSSTNKNAIYNESTGEVSITGGTVSSTSTNSPTIFNNSTGTVAVSGSATVSSTNKNAIYNKDAGTITVSGGKVSSTGTDNGFAIYNYGTGTVTVSGGEVSSTQNYSIYNYGTGTVEITGNAKVTSTKTTIYNYSTGAVTVSGSAIVDSTNDTAIENKVAGTVTVSGGTVSSTGSNGNAIKNSSTGNVNITGGTVSSTGSNGNAIFNNSTGTVAVSGSATVSSTNKNAIYNTGTGKVTVSGGSPVIKGDTMAMNTAPTLGAGVTVKAYSDYNAQTLVTPYVESDIRTYRCLKFETGSTGGGDNPGGGSTGGSTGGGSSSSGSSSNITVTPSPDKLNVPTEAEIKVKAKVDSKGGATVNVSYKDVTNAIKKATAEAKKSGDEANGITLVLNATTGNKTVNTLTVNLPKTVQEKVISNKIVSTVVVVDNPDIKIGMDLKAVTEINAQAKSDVTIRSTRMDSNKLTDSAKIAIGNRPVFNLSVNYGSDKQVQNFKSGSVSVSIPYTLQAGEVAGGVYAVYVDGNGKVNYIANSSYDTNAKVLRFATNHFSIYGIGYKVPIAFTDIASHWAKSDIDFVTNRGLISGTSDTTFAPNSAMTRGMFVTALGRLAGVDVNSYKTGSFTDVKPETYYAPYANWAASNGITNGTTPTTFSPDKNVTRQEMAMMMSNYTKVYGYTVPKTRREVIFADNRSINSWAIDAIKQMQIAGIINGKNGNMFDPTGTATRGEISAMLHRYIELVIDRNTAEGWTINDSGSAMYYRNGKAVTGSKIINRVTYKFNSYGETTQKVILAGKNN